VNVVCAPALAELGVRTGRERRGARRRHDQTGKSERQAATSHMRPCVFRACLFIRGCPHLSMGPGRMADDRSGLIPKAQQRYGSEGEPFWQLDVEVRPARLDALSCQNLAFRGVALGQRGFSTEVYKMGLEDGKERSISYGVT
jgi:hypothetical protein